MIFNLKARAINYKKSKNTILTCHKISKLSKTIFKLIILKTCTCISFTIALIPFVGIDLGFKKIINASGSGGILKFSFTSKTIFTNLDKEQVHVIKTNMS